MTGGFQRSAKKWMDWFEGQADTYSKNLFKTLKLYHWSQQSKMILTLLIGFAPICFIFVAAICLVFVTIYN